MAVNLYVDDKGIYALQTDAPDEETFRKEFVEALTVLVEKQVYAGKWTLPLHRWLGQFVDICYAYQGYKPVTVEMRTLYTAGPVVLQEAKDSDVLPLPSPIVLADKVGDVLREQ